MPLLTLLSCYLINRQLAGGTPPLTLDYTFRNFVVDEMRRHFIQPTMSMKTIFRVHTPKTMSAQRVAAATYNHLFALGMSHLAGQGSIAIHRLWWSHSSRFFIEGSLPIPSNIHPSQRCCPLNGYYIHIYMYSLSNG